MSEQIQIESSKICAIIKGNKRNKGVQMVLVATQVKRRRGTTAENDAFAGAEGEITVDLTNKELRVHDGSGKLGGFRIGRHTDRSNCITEIPQDIKLELNNGTLTLKAGSKVYVPNGFESDGTTPKFNVITINNDVSGTISYNGVCIIAYRPDKNSVALWNINSGASGSTDPTITATFYNTTQNIMKRFDTGLTVSGFSFPIGLATTTTGGVQSIDQIFNGFGYIGSTVFALPDVKGLIPDGRNADGSLKNIETSTSKIVTRTFSSAYNGTYNILIGGNEFGALKAIYSYNELENRNKDGSSDYNLCYVGILNIVSGAIKSFLPKTVFHALDYNDTDFIAHQAMPSNRYVDLTLGASAATYTAPADGWVIFRRTSTASGQYIQLVNNTSANLQYFVQSGANSGVIGVSMPVKKGDNFLVSYTLGSANNQIFRFIYAQGAK